MPEELEDREISSLHLRDERRDRLKDECYKLELVVCQQQQKNEQPSLQDPVVRKRRKRKPNEEDQGIGPIWRIQKWLIPIVEMQDEVEQQAQYKSNPQV